MTTRKLLLDDTVSDFRKPSRLPLIPLGKQWMVRADVCMQYVCVNVS